MEKISKMKQKIESPIIGLFIPMLFFTVYLTSCINKTENINQTTKSNIDSSTLVGTQDSALDSIVLFLLNMSAKDFFENQPPMPIGFRNVEVRNLTAENKGDNYMICGQFLTQDKQGKEEWTSFATIKTDPYEQWIGSNALTYCQAAKAIVYKKYDLSSALKNRIVSLQNSKH